MITLYSKTETNFNHNGPMILQQIEAKGMVLVPVPKQHEIFDKLYAQSKEGHNFKSFIDLIMG